MDEDVALVAPLPSGVSEGAVAAPNLERTASVRVEQWDARCLEASCKAQAVLACFRADAGTWSDEVGAIAEDKLVETASNAAFRARGEGALRVTGESNEGAAHARELEGDGLAGKTLLGFSDGAVHACFALCVGARGSRPGCAESVQNAHFSRPISGPPETSLALRAVSLAVHHPRHALAGLSLTLALWGVLAIVKRPRRRRARHAR